MIAKGGGRIVGGTDAEPGEFPYQVLFNKDFERESCDLSESFLSFFSGSNSQYLIYAWPFNKSEDI